MNITVGRYQDVPAFEGYVEPEDRSWIVFFTQDGSPLFWANRDEQGGVIGNPVTR